MGMFSTEVNARRAGLAVEDDIWGGCWDWRGTSRNRGWVLSEVVAAITEGVRFDGIVKASDWAGWEEVAEDVDGIVKASDWTGWEEAAEDVDWGGDGGQRIERVVKTDDKSPVLADVAAVTILY